MIILTAALQAKKGKETEVEQILVHMVSETAQEKGALEYRLHKSKNNDGSFLFYEKYSGQTAFENHVASAHYKQLGEQLGGLLAKEPIIDFYDFITGITE
ncbi:putative quinol monooxygenase [Maridesulfovibrio ferrireducens]|uniref:putative quinol monooxygenase n=1 Tax=Maridesulfovibrio ferrireducens TaxID=246191 RepID=UPI001A32C635|nr:putative quinol monooxygenase [Maridesulfovibrio ferrireducens]MBI9111907.1 antibiotic biosynthesis monooxygenase [Maridesulfovibrio ferrireducens]